MKKTNNPYHKGWFIIYKLYPPILRVLEKAGIHRGRQDFFIGSINQEKHNAKSLENYLLSIGFEPALLAWRDEQEILSMRKVDQKIYQWHIRLHSDGEIRGHYEYSSEGNPIGHILEKKFTADSDFFMEILIDFLKK